MSAAPAPRIPLPHRLDDWGERLHAVLSEFAFKPFSWGTHDCVTIAADVVQALTGTDPLADLRGNWSDERTALRLLQHEGGLGLAVSFRLGEPVRPAFATTGDIVMVHNGRAEMLAICNAGALLVPCAHGLETPSQWAAPALCAWKVG